MKNILIFAGIAGLAAAIAIYFTGESFKTDETDSDYITDVDIDEYNKMENTGSADLVL